MYIKTIPIYYTSVIVGNVFSINYSKYLLLTHISVAFLPGFAVSIEPSAVPLRSKARKPLISRKIPFSELSKLQDIFQKLVVWITCDVIDTLILITSSHHNSFTRTFSRTFPGFLNNSRCDKNSRHGI